jgi:hypothetical protein
MKAEYAELVAALKWFHEAHRCPDCDSDTAPPCPMADNAAQLLERTPEGRDCPECDGMGHTTYSDACLACSNTGFVPVPE